MTATAETLLRATRSAVVAVRRDLATAQRQLRDHAVSGFGALAPDRLRVLDQHVTNAENLIRDIAGALFVAEGPLTQGEPLPKAAQEFIDQWDSTDGRTGDAA